MIITFLKGLFFIIGMIGAYKENYCMIVTFAVYMTISSIWYFIKAFSAAKFWPLALIYIVMTATTYIFAQTIKEKRIRLSDLQVVEPPKTDLNPPANNPQPPPQPGFVLTPESFNARNNVVITVGYVPPPNILPPISSSPSHYPSYSSYPPPPYPSAPPAHWSSDFNKHL